MNGIDATTWQAIGLTLTVVGLLLSVLLWRRRGPASGLRGVAWSLLPAAAGLTGSLKLVYDIGDSVVRWATHLVFSPVVWAGVALAGTSLALFAIAAAMRSRGVGTRRPAGDRHAVTDRRSAPPAQRSTPAGAAGPAGGQDDDLDDIEAILRKHGIS